MKRGKTFLLVSWRIEAFHTVIGYLSIVSATALLGFPSVISSPDCVVRGSVGDCVGDCVVWVTVGDRVGNCIGDCVIGDSVGDCAKSRGGRYQYLCRPLLRPLFAPIPKH